MFPGYAERMPAETIAERLAFLLGSQSSELKGVAEWPPDVFAICSSILMCSGVYSLLVDDKPLQGRPRASGKRAKDIESVAQSWRRSVSSNSPLPDQIAHWWEVVRNRKGISIRDLSEDRDVSRVLLDLMSAADAACHGIGIFAPESHSAMATSDNFSKQADRRLVETMYSKHGSTLCGQIDPSRGRVLPKMHTPQSGLTIRSLSHNLAYCYTPDVSPQWLSAAIDPDDHSFNILLVPWPKVVHPSQFVASRKVEITDTVRNGSYGLFSYATSGGPNVEFIESLIQDAARRIGRVDAIIFPELAMSKAEFEAIASSVGDDRFIVSGVGSCASGPFKSGENEAILQTKVTYKNAEFHTRFSQRKHHRWKLTKSQVSQYGIGQNLHPSVNWWEHIQIAARTLSFVTLRPWLTVSVLICEDLARPDPMGDILRAVGPNLIIALLCDAPQLISRWPGRYAGAFADDPGSSVLTLTSSGMSSLSQPQPGKADKSRTVALWRDPKSEPKEIELPPSADAVLLNLAVEYHEEWTADGRGDGGNVTGYPVLAAHHPIFASQNESEMPRTSLKNPHVVRHAKRPKDRIR